MGCRICGRDCPPEAKICRDCAAARKRAFAQTVTQPLLAAVGVPSVAARFAPKPLRPRAANDSKVQRPKVEREPPRPDPEPALPLTQVPRRLSVLWLLGGVVLVAIIVGLLLRSSGNGGHTAEDTVPTIEPAPAPSTRAAPVIPAPTPAASATPFTEHSSSEPPMSKAPAVKPRKVAPHVDAPSPVIVPPALAEPAPVTSPTPAPRAVETPRTDPWQALNEGLARCAREALFDRIGCEQRLRMQYCANSWGLVPQCPIGPANDHGQ
jgi:hypothetical protein